MQGQMEIPLNKLGEQQAEQIGVQLKDFPIDVLYTSPQVRAHRTAKAIRQHHPNTPMHTHTLLKERNFGTLEGKSFEEICSQYPTMAFDKNWDHPYFQAEGGESIIDVYNRGKQFLSEILSEHEGKTIAIISHGVTIRCMVCYILNLPMYLNPFFEINNTSLSLIKKPKKGEAQLQFINNITHLHEDAYSG